jgi:hypothetical protein
MLTIFISLCPFLITLLLSIDLLKQTVVYKRTKRETRIAIYMELPGYQITALWIAGCELYTEMSLIPNYHILFEC